MNHDNNPNKKGNQDQARRTTLKTLLTGGGFVTLSALPAQWVKPVVDAVVLPGHAQTSPAEAPNGATVDVVVVARAPSWLDTIIPVAHAGLPTFSAFLCIEATGSSSFTASLAASGDVATGGGNYGDCVTLGCDSFDAIDVIVTGQNADGSFDFALYLQGEECDTGDLIDSGTTDTPCNVEGACKKDL